MVFKRGRIIMLDDKDYKNDKEKFDIVPADPEFIKRPISEILEDVDKIDSNKVAEEVLEWVIENVENFIDTQSKTFKLDLVVDSSESMQETKKLQDLYRAIPDDEECTEQQIEEAQQTRRILDKVVSRSFDIIQTKKEDLDNLFKRMKYFYEKVIPSSENKKRALEIDEELKVLINQKESLESQKEKDTLQKQINSVVKEGESLINYESLGGSVSIINFDYEAFSVGVKLLEGQNPDDKEVKEKIEKAVYKQYVIPEGFAVWVQISVKQEQRQIALF